VAVLPLTIPLRALDIQTATQPVNVTQLLGTAWLTPGTAGTPDINAKLIGGTAQTGADIGSLVAKFTGITRLSHWLGAIMGKQAADATAQTEIRASGAGSGTFDPTTDSTEALRDRGDAAWITATGFSTLDAAGVRTAVGLAAANLDTQLGDLPTNAELSTALGTADDAVLTAIAALNNLSAAQVATALANYDGPTNAEMEARTLTASSIAKLTAHLLGVLTFVLDAGSTTTTLVLLSVNGTTASAVDDFYNGAVVVFTSGALLGQRTSISDYNGATGVATVVALTGSPASGVTGIIV
jgi:hypothetical protein